MSAALLRGGLVVPLDERDTPPGAWDVLVRDGRIEALLPDTAKAHARTQRGRPDPEAGRRTPGAGTPADTEVVDCTGKIVLPGLVNAHLHPDLHLLRGRLEDLSLHDWTGCVPLQRSLDVLDGPDGESLQRAAVRAALVECMLAGQTTVVCYGVTKRIERIAAETLDEFGLHGRVTIRDVDFQPASPLARAHMFRLHAEEALTPQELDAARRAHERGEWIVMHVAETTTRVDIARERFGTTPIRLLARHGLLSPRVLLSHAVHVDDEEIDLIARAGAVVLASPVAEAKLADGLAPVARMHERGVRIALGTDAAVCNNSCDLLLEARVLGLLQRMANGAATLPADTLLRFATVDGAAALGADAARGLAPGAPADLILLDATAPHLLPLVHEPGGPGNLFAGVVFSGTGRDVTDVMAAGRWVVRDRLPVALDVNRIGAELAEAARELIRRTSE